MDHKWLVDLRKKRGWTQEKVAEKAGIERSYIAKIEAGQTPSVRVAKSLGKALRFSWQKFFIENCETGSQKPTGTDQ